MPPQTPQNHNFPKIQISKSMTNALEKAIDHPIAKVLVAGLEGYLE